MQQSTQSNSAVRTFPLQSSQTFLRPYLNGLESETSDDKIGAAKEFLMDNFEEVCDLAENSKTFCLDFPKMMSDSTLNDAWPTLKNDIDENAELVLGKNCSAGRSAFSYRECLLLGRVS